MKNIYLVVQYTFKKHKRSLSIKAKIEYLNLPGVYKGILQNLWQSE